MRQTCPDPGENMEPLKRSASIRVGEYPEIILRFNLTDNSACFV
jgi:hypothetical protein